ncbi:MAG: hypothetical protein QM733_00690 [Ilumatobacteraceae bacterium]
MRFAVEPWAPEYGVAADQANLEATPTLVAVDVELAAEGWAPIVPAATGAVPARILFVDGVRRVDAQVWFEDGAVSRRGVSASVAAGSVCSAGDRAAVDEVVVERGFFARATPAAASIDTVHGRYHHVPCPGDTADDINLAIHRMMTAIESRIAATHDADLVVFDGPLRQRIDRHAIGYVKTQQVQYLPDELQAVVGRLGTGERSPLFLLEGQGARYSWYLRLPGPRAQPLSGVVRIEVPALGCVAEVVARADAVSRVLPRFASEAHKDPRAPHNLYPIAGLEQRLRHLLGDQLVVERALRRAAVLR